MEERMPLILELGHICHKRNLINARRTNARFKASYYKYASNTIKWSKNPSGLKRMVLKYRAEEAKAKYDTARHTKATHKRVLQLLKQLGMRLRWDNGYVYYFGTKDYSEYTYREEFEAMYKEVEANRAIDRMLNGNGKKKTSSEKDKTIKEGGCTDSI